MKEKNFSGKGMEVKANCFVLFCFGFSINPDSRVVERRVEKCEVEGNILSSEEKKVVQWQSRMHS